MQPDARRQTYRRTRPISARAGTTTRPTSPTARCSAGSLTLVALSADGDSANDPNLIAIKAYASYLTGTIGLYPSGVVVSPLRGSERHRVPGRRWVAHSDTSSGQRLHRLPVPVHHGPSHSIWLTEVAAQITDPVPTYFGAPEGCARPGRGRSRAGTAWAACLDGNPRAQAYAASDFLDLARVGLGLPRPDHPRLLAPVRQPGRSPDDLGLRARGARRSLRAGELLRVVRRERRAGDLRPRVQSDRAEPRTTEAVERRYPGSPRRRSVARHVPAAVVRLQPAPPRLTRLGR